VPPSLWGRPSAKASVPRAASDRGTMANAPLPPRPVAIEFTWRQKRAGKTWERQRSHRPRAPPSSDWACFVARAAMNQKKIVEEVLGTRSRKAEGGKGPDRHTLAKVIVGRVLPEVRKLRRQGVLPEPGPPNPPELSCTANRGQKRVRPRLGPRSPHGFRRTSTTLDVPLKRIRPSPLHESHRQGITPRSF